MQQHVKELRHLGFDIQQILGNGQMAGAGDGQEFRDALYQAQQEGRKICHRVTSCHIRILFVISGMEITVCYRLSQKISNIVYHIYEKNATVIYEERDGLRRLFCAIRFRPSDPANAV